MIKLAKASHLTGFLLLGSFSSAFAEQVEYIDERTLSVFLEDGYSIQATSPILDGDTQVGFHVFMQNNESLLFCAAQFELFAGLTGEFDWCVETNEGKRD